MKETDIEFMGIKIYVYSNGIRGFFERLWHDLKYKTVWVPEPPKHYGPFTYARFKAGRFLLEERDWYKFIRGSVTSLNSLEICEEKANKDE